MGQTSRSPALEQLRRRIAHLERHERPPSPVLLPFGVAAVDTRLPSGGLVTGALHEVAGGGQGALHGAAAVLFVAGVLARLPGPVLWCLRQRDLVRAGPGGSRSSPGPGDLRRGRQRGGGDDGAGGGAAPRRLGRCGGRGGRVVDDRLAPAAADG